MASGSRRKHTEKSIPIIKLHIPKSLKINKTIEMAVPANQFTRTWMEIFSEINQKLYAKVRAKPDQFVITDRRRPKNEWKLNNVIKDFIDGFSRTRQSYTATLVIASRPLIQPHSSMNRTPATPRSSRRQQATKASPGTGRKRKHDHPDTQRPATRRRTEEVHEPFNFEALLNPLHGAPPAVRINFADAGVDADADDAASMCSQDSQDSQDDLLEAGIAIEDIKEQVVQRMRQGVDNNLLLRARTELDKLKTQGKWSRLVSRAPLTAGILQIIFNVHDV